MEEERPPPSATQSHSPVQKPERSRTATSVHLLGLFYSYFFQAHPFVLPRAHLSEKFAKNDSPQLQAAVEYVGACYDPTIGRAEHVDNITQRLFISAPPRDGFTVQAMLLSAIALHANNEKERALDILRRAVTLAMDIGMHLPAFATSNGNGDVVQEESWRRTFWELFIVERILATENHSPESIVITHTPVEVPLPCEESEYLGGTVYRHRTLDDYDNRAFLGENIIFPSYAYRIDASRILANALPLAYSPFPDDTYIQKVDYDLAQWCLYLPNEKRKVVSNDDICDEVLFHAHALAFWYVLNSVLNSFLTDYSAGMFLHRPRSTLARSRFLNPVLDCCPIIPLTTSISTQTAPYHTAFVMKAADSIVKLGNMPRSTMTHTPLFNFCLLLSSSTHLAIWPHVRAGRFPRQGSTPFGASSESIHDDGSTRNSIPSQTGSDETKPFVMSFEDDPNNLVPNDMLSSSSGSPDQTEIKDRVRLLLGSLKRISQIWPSAKIAMEEVQTLSMQLFTATSPPKSSPAGTSMYEMESSSTDPSQTPAINFSTVTYPPALGTSAIQSPSVPVSQSSSQPPDINMFDALNHGSFLPANYYGGNTGHVQASYANDGSLLFDSGHGIQAWQGEHDDLIGLVGGSNIPTSLG